MARAIKRASHPEALIEVEIAHLRGLDLQGLRARWKSTFRRQPPPHVPRHLLFAVLAYRIQADRLGDLSPEVKALLERSIPGESRANVVDRLTKLDQQQRQLMPGTLLTRSWRGRPQRVMVMADGFSWNGRVYDSLSKVACAITGTRWNGPRFFGLRDKQPIETRLSDKARR